MIHPLKSARQLQLKMEKRKNCRDWLPSKTQRSATKESISDNEQEVERAKEMNLKMVTRLKEAVESEDEAEYEERRRKYT